MPECKLAPYASSDLDWSRLSSTELAGLADFYRYHNAEENPCFFDPQDAVWRYHLFDPAMLKAFSSRDEAKAWIDEEIAMLRANDHGSAADWYEHMLKNGFREPVTIGWTQGEGKLWDGWHRTAIAMVRNERMPAILGFPRTISVSLDL